MNLLQALLEKDLDELVVFSAESDLVKLEEPRTLHQLSL